MCVHICAPLYICNLWTLQSGLVASYALILSCFHVAFVYMYAWFVTLSHLHMMLSTLIPVSFFNHQVLCLVWTHFCDLLLWSVPFHWFGDAGFLSLSCACLNYFVHVLLGLCWFEVAYDLCTTVPLYLYPVHCCTYCFCCSFYSLISYSYILTWTDHWNALPCLCWFVYLLEYWFELFCWFLIISGWFLKLYLSWIQFQNSGLTLCSCRDVICITLELNLAFYLGLTSAHLSL